MKCDTENEILTLGAKKQVYTETNSELMQKFRELYAISLFTQSFLVRLLYLLLSFFLCVLCCCCCCLYNVCLLSFDLDEIRPFSLHRSFLVLSWYELEAWVPRYNYTSKFKMLLCFQIQSKPICVLDTQQLLIVGIFCYACVKLQCRCCFSVFVCDVRRSNCHSVEFMFEMPSRGR